ncbi:SNARE-interacting protein KEULE [Capsicum baccatum]|uniref:SNARE-interacting protein KEULE n=1 Tax=Capsicum baccatum TaxID=33114 RepID=A0A2G2XKK3_CAPBA|nr:SNARE-interacting protein KEULE [Capsicum baccatum]
MDTSNLIIIVPITIANMFVMSAKIGKNLLETLRLTANFSNTNTDYCNLVGTLISTSLLCVSILMSHYILYNPFMAQTLKQEFKGLITDNDRAIEEGQKLCESLIVDRSVDQIDPIILEWTYDAMCNNLFNMYGNKFVHEDETRKSKLCLLMIYAAVYPEKLDSDKLSKLMELARLPQDNMNAVYNMRLMGGSTDNKKNSLGAFSLKFNIHKKKHASRKDRTDQAAIWQLSHSCAMIKELVEQLSKGELPKNDYPCMNDPSPTFHENSQSASIQANQVLTPHSMRSRRTATWARPRECILVANVWSSLCTTM